jgi:hypothetical protein
MEIVKDAIVFVKAKMIVSYAKDCRSYVVRYGSFLLICWIYRFS